MKNNLTKRLLCDILYGDNIGSVAVQTELPLNRWTRFFYWIGG